ncbi:MAG: 30S ribosomal protein S12 methylthiotransferase RimO [Gammaproteobacteria bacterium]
MKQMEKRSNKIGFVSLGCPKALVDSENMITHLKSEGYETSNSYQEAGIVVINTCGFVNQAIEESLDAIGEAMAENGKVIVTGCLGTNREIIKNRYPNVLSISGPNQISEVVQQIHRHLPPEENTLRDYMPPQRIKLTPRHYAYLKISEGCNHSCTFCIIPSLRGRLVSRNIGDVLSDAATMVKGGVKELLVIAQDTSAYGLDIGYQTGFWSGKPVRSRFKELVEQLGGLGAWLRLHYIYPYPHIDEIIPLMSEGMILPYLDIPFQHSEPALLKAMKRPARSDNTLSRIKCWREICPDIGIRSTFIVGFPGKSDSAFEHLLEFIEEAQLDRIGCFTYSPVAGARANDLPDPVPEEIKQERMERLMTQQAEISKNKLKNRIGSQIQVVIDEITEDQAIARSKYDAPDIDGQVYVDSSAELSTGDKINVIVTDSDDHDLYARIGENY